LNFTSAGNSETRKAKIVLPMCKVPQNEDGNFHEGVVKLMSVY
jgi:hypothetical protein